MPTITHFSTTSAKGASKLTAPSRPHHDHQTADSTARGALGPGTVYTVVAEAQDKDAQVSGKQYDTPNRSAARDDIAETKKK